MNTKIAGIMILIALMTASFVYAEASIFDIYAVGFNNGRTRFTPQDSFFDEVGDNGLSGVGIETAYFIRGSSGAWQPLSTDLTGDGGQDIIIANGGCYDFKTNPPAGYICETAPTGISIIDGKTGTIISEIGLNLFDGYISGYYLDDIDLNGVRELLVLSNSTLFVLDWDESSNNHFDMMKNVSICGGYGQHCLTGTSVPSHPNFAEISCVNHGAASGQTICYINTANGFIGSIPYTGKFAVVNISRDGNWIMHGQFIVNTTMSSMAVCDFDGDIYDDVIYYSNLFDKVKAFEYDYTTNTFNVYGGNYGTFGEAPSLYGGIACGSIDGDNLAEVYIAPSASRDYGVVDEGTLGGARFYTGTGYSVGMTRNSYGMSLFSSNTGICVGQSEDGIPKCFNGYSEGTIIFNNYSVGLTNENMIFINNNNKLAYFRTYDLSTLVTPPFTNGIAGFLVENNPDIGINYKFNITDTTTYTTYPQMIVADFSGDGSADLLVTNAYGGTGGASRIFYSNTITTPENVIDTSCTSPCIFYDNFTYSVSVCNAGWDGLQQQDCGRAKGNSTHLLCNNYPFSIHRSFSPLTYQNGFIYVDFKYKQSDTNYFIDVWALDSAGDVITGFFFDGYEGYSRYNGAGGTASVIDTLDTNNHKYTMKIDLSTQTTDFYVDDVLKVSGAEFPYKTNVADISSITVTGDFVFNSCYYNMDYITLYTQTAPDVTTPTLNATNGEYLGNDACLNGVCLSLKSENAYFDRAYCKENEGRNMCFFRAIFGGAFNWVTTLMLDNILAIFVLIVILMLIGLVVR